MTNMISDEELAEIGAGLPLDAPRALQVDILDPAQRSSEPVERWKREAEETQRRREQAHQQRKQREADIVADRAKAWAEAKAAAEPGFSDVQSDVLAHLIMELRREFRAELDKNPVRASGAKVVATPPEQGHSRCSPAAARFSLIGIACGGRCPPGRSQM